MAISDTYDRDLPGTYGKDDNPPDNWENTSDDGDDDKWVQIDTINYGNEVKKND